MDGAEAGRKTSLIVLNYNGGQRMLAWAQHLRAQNQHGLSIIMVDNASDDGIMDVMQSQWPDMVFLRNRRNLGFAGGINVGLRYALAHGADWCWILNYDTDVPAHVLPTLLRQGETNSRIGAVGARIYPFAPEENTPITYGGGRVLWLQGRAREFHAPVCASQLDFITGACMLLRSTALREIGLFDERFFMYWEDVDLCLRLKNKGWTLSVAQDASLWHEGNATLGRGHPKLIEYHNRSALMFFKKHSPCPWWSNGVGSSGRFMKSIFRRRWDHCAAIARSWREQA